MSTPSAQRLAFPTFFGTPGFSRFCDLRAPVVVGAMAGMLVSLGCAAPPSGPEAPSSDQAPGDGPGTSDAPFQALFRTLGPATCLTQAEQTFGFPADATLAPGVDFVAGYIQNSSLALGVPVLRIGEACRSAEDRGSCESALAQPSDHEGGFLPCEDCPILAHVRSTKGDTVDVFELDPEQVVATYLPIDTPREALARVAARRDYAALTECTGKDVAREATGSFLVHTKRVDCDISLGGAGPYTLYTHEFIVRVDPSGVMTELASAESQRTSQQCPVESRRVP